MQTRPRGKVTAALLQRRRRRIWGRVVSVMAAIVVFCTTYALILPAITQERDRGTICGLPEHVHTDACYDLLASTSITKTICTVTEAIHTHDALCYAADGVTLRCALAERVVHVHTPECFAPAEAAHVHTDVCYEAVRGGLVCTQPELEGHTHNEKCYTSKESIVCGVPEVEGHKHGDMCYTVSETLICQLPEIEGHKHDEACFKNELVCSLEEAAHKHDAVCRPTTLVCTLEESAGHAHGEGCVLELICPLEEAAAHKHDASCFAEKVVCPLEETEAHRHDESCRSLSCGKEITAGHSHDEACYTEQMICTQPELEPHAHGETCRSLTCGQAVTEGHAHSEACYKIEQQQICTDVTEGHVHGAGCFTENKTEICGQAEVPAHAHSDACYTLTCQKEETAGHAHGGACRERKLTCTQPEVESHAHTDACYTITCGKTEGDGHTHTEACRAQEKICVREESDGHAHGEGCFACKLPVSAGHAHGEGCYTTAVCPIPETDGHVHDAACYRQTQICTLEEVEGHKHGETCKSSEKTLTCLEPEAEGHKHTAECKKVESELTCLVPEVEGHKHADACYEMVRGEKLICLLPTEAPLPQLICPIVDPAPHQHSEACFAIETTAAQKTLKCLLKEHTHAAECRPTADASAVEPPELWMATLPALTGNTAEDLIAVAQSQLGYTESYNNYIIHPDKTVSGYTRYGDWWGDPYGDWSTMFAAFCVRHAEIGGMPLAGDALTWIARLSEAGLYAPKNMGVPNPGTLVFLDKNGDTIADTTAIIAAYYNGVVTVYEGDVKGEVAISSYSMFADEIVGFAETSVRLDTSLPCRLPEHMHDAGCVNAAGEYVCVLPSHMHSYECFGVGMFENSATSRAGKVTIYEVDATAGGVPAVLNNGISNRALLVHGSTVETITKRTCDWQKVYRFASVGNGLYQVEEIWEAGRDIKKGNVSATNGFVIVINGSLPVQVEKGVYATIDFPLKTAAYSENSTKTLTFYNVDYQQDNTSALHRIETASTKDFVTINMFDYGSGSTGTNINNGYSDTSTRLGFSQDGGPTGAYGGYDRFSNSSLYVPPSARGFGNILTADLADGRDLGTSSSNPLNKSAGNSTGKKNGGMTKTLVNNYPQSWNEQSWNYLFTESTYTKKKNSKNVDGLFQYNEVTGAYTFDSRKNFAQFNESSNTFTVYDEILTPNFVNYPFGNFLPYQNISTQATKVTTIDENYIRAMQASAASKKATETDTTFKGAYEKLETVMGLYATHLAKESTNTNGTYNGEAYYNKPYYQLAIAEYYAKNQSLHAGTNGGTTNTALPDSETLNRLYNIDFDEVKDFFFGMEIRMDFMMPKDGKTGLNGNVDMEFDFRGDDDVVVYIDDVLFLDLSGIHRHIGGRIDFVNGKVEYYDFNPATAQANKHTVFSDSPDGTYTFAQILRAAGKTDADLDKILVKNADGTYGTFIDYTTHHFAMFYMERGSGSSVCAINFNFPLLRKNAIAVEKVLTSDGTLTQAEKDAMEDLTFTFQLLRAFDLDNDGIAESKLNDSGKEEPFANGSLVNNQYILWDSDTKQQIGTYYADKTGAFTIKAGQLAEFPNIGEHTGFFYIRELIDATADPQYGTVISAGGETHRENPTTGIEYDGSIFNGYDSPIYSTDDSTVFHFTYENQLISHRLGSMAIEKIVQGSEPLNPDGTRPTYQMQVWLNKNPLAPRVPLNPDELERQGYYLLPPGVPYYVYDNREAYDADMARLAALPETAERVPTPPRRTVITPGVIEMTAGQVVHIPALTLGTKYVVQEVVGEKALYTATISDDGVGEIKAVDLNGNGVIDDGDFAGETPQPYQHVTVTVTNTYASMILPETGGIGTVPYTICGIALLTLAAWMAYRRLRV